MSNTVTAGKIKFEFNLDELFDKVSLDTLTHASKMTDPKTGEDQVDQFGMVEEERSSFNQYVQEGSIRVFQKLVKMTSGIADGFTIALTGTPPKVTFEIKDKVSYNANYLQIIDDEISLALMNFVMKEWFSKCNLGDLAKYYNEKYNENIRMIIRNSISLRKPSLT
jgi:hypothetical protein